MSNKITEFGAWAGLNGLKNPEKYKKLIKSVGVDRIDFMINDGSAKKPFHTYLPEDKLIETLINLKGGGAKVCITTWVQPEESWAKGMETVGRIATNAKLDRVTLDAEESYINVLKNKSPIEILTWAIGIIGTLRKNFDGVIAIAPTVFSNKKVLNDLLKLVDLIIPQTYSTVKNVPGAGHDGSLEKTTMDIYRGYGAPIVMGAAAWNLEGAYGKDAISALRTSIETSLNLGVTELMYWRFEFLTGKILETIREYLREKESVV